MSDIENCSDTSDTDTSDISDGKDVLYLQLELAKKKAELQKINMEEKIESLEATNASLRGTIGKLMEQLVQLQQQQQLHQQQLEQRQQQKQQQQKLRQQERQQQKQQQRQQQLQQQFQQQQPQPRQWQPQQWHEMPQHYMTHDQYLPLSPPMQTHVPAFMPVPEYYHRHSQVRQLYHRSRSHLQGSQDYVRNRIVERSRSPTVLDQRMVERSRSPGAAGKKMVDRDRPPIEKRDALDRCSLSSRLPPLDFDPYNKSIKDISDKAPVLVVSVRDHRSAPLIMPIIEDTELTHYSLHNKGQATAVLVYDPEHYGVAKCRIIPKNKIPFIVYNESFKWTHNTFDILYDAGFAFVVLDYPIFP